MVKRIDHLDLNVRNLTEWIEFFENLDFEVIRRTPDRAELQLPGSNQPIIEIHIGGPLNPGLDHIALLVDDVEKETQKLKGKGLIFEREAYPVRYSGRKVSNVITPDGWLLQLVDAMRGDPQE